MRGKEFASTSSVASQLTIDTAIWLVASSDNTMTPVSNAIDAAPSGSAIPE